jgi:hypothetical protein
MRTVMFGLALAAAACTGDDTDGNGNGTDIVPGDRSVLEELPGRDPPCEEFTNAQGETFVEIEGATRFLATEVAVEGTDMSGYLYLALFPNVAWKATTDWQNSPAKDKDVCVAAYALSGAVVDDNDISCAGCDLFFLMDQTLDSSASDCPSQLLGTLTPSATEVGWAVDVQSGGVTVKDTQREWAPNGKGDEKGFLAWSDGSCAWYGTGVPK